MTILCDQANILKYNMLTTPTSNEALLCKSSAPCISSCKPDGLRIHIIITLTHAPRVKKSVIWGALYAPL